MALKKRKNDYLNRKWEFNIGIAVFILILFYILACLYMSSKSEPIRGYQVKNGALSENRLYTGIALRKENTVTTDYSGYVNYFVREGERTAYNGLVYCIDETGKLSDLIGNNPSEDNSLTVSELLSLRQDIQLFSKGFNEKSFLEATTFRSSILNKLAQIENHRIIEDVTAINSQNSNDIIDYCRAKSSGIVAFYNDGYEAKTASEIVISDFDESTYQKKIINNDDLVESGQFIYKYTTDENWSIVIMVPQDDIPRISSLEYVEVKFSKTLTSSWAEVHYIRTIDNYGIYELRFTNSMITFCKDRFVEIELLLAEDTGLKVPKSAITEKAFYVIDKDYVIKGGNTNSYSVLRSEYNETGQITKDIQVDIVNETEDSYYIDSISLSYGDVLVKPKAPMTESGENTLILSRTGTLTGVYKINKGYAEFCQVTIKSENEEYSIIEPYSLYGLRAYDYIALDGNNVSDADFVY